MPRGTNPLFSSNSSEDSSKTLVYSGTLAKNEGLELYFNSIRLLRGDCQYAVTGKGRDERRTRNLARDLDISFHWFSKRSAYLDFLSKCSVGIIPWRMTLTRQLGFPMKLLDYMSVGLPVICSNIGSWSEIIESYDIGLLCKPSPPEFASSINLLLSDETRIRSMSQHAAELSEGPFNWRESAKKLIEAYQNCSNV